MPSPSTQIMTYNPAEKKLRTSRWKITITPHDDSPSLVHELAAESTLLGTRDDCDLVIHDPFVSRHHCRLTPKDETLWLEDVESTNGTLLHGARVERVRLLPQSSFVIGKTRITVGVKTCEELVSPSHRTSLGKMLGKSREMRELFRLIEKVAPSNAPVLIHGESGTGKELVARLLHDLSDRKKNAFVPINCAAIPENLMEGMLFGHERGAFTGAIVQQRGLFEEADNGTLFLDEIAELPLTLQAKLLRVLEEKKVRPLGKKGEVSVNARIVAATHRDLSKLVVEGKFRSDLFYRLMVVPIEIAPLRKRPDDIPLLVEHFLKEFSSQKEQYELTSRALERLTTSPWPGNIRELKHVLQRSIMLASRKLLDVDDLHFPSWQSDDVSMTTFKMFERHSIENALKRHNGNQSLAALELGMARSTLRKKIRKLGVLHPTPWLPQGKLFERGG